MSNSWATTIFAHWMHTCGINDMPFPTNLQTFQLVGLLHAIPQPNATPFQRLPKGGFCIFYNNMYSCIKEDPYAYSCNGLAIKINGNFTYGWTLERYSNLFSVFICNSAAIFCETESNLDIWIANERISDEFRLLFQQFSHFCFCFCSWCTDYSGLNNKQSGVSFR